MGEVWRARHRMLARPAAISSIRPSFARDGRGGVSEEAVRRFEREAQVDGPFRRGWTEAPAATSRHRGPSSSSIT